MPIPNSPVFIIDGNVSIPESLEELIRSAGWQPETSSTLLERLADRSDMAVIRITIEQSGQVLDRETELQQFRSSYASLSVRERQVMALVAAGLLNKQVGARLGISEITVKAHRGKVMRKMGASSLAELVAIALRLQLPSAGRYQSPIASAVLLANLVAEQAGPTAVQ